MLTGWVGPFVHQYGLWGLGVDVFLEAMGAPLPGETLLVIAAGMSAQGTFDIRLVALVAFVAAVLGDNLGYLIGRKFGRPVVLKHGARFGITPTRLERVESALNHRGAIIVVVARFVVLLRQLNGLAAGTVGMHWARFATANAIGAALWVGTWAVLGRTFGVTAEHIPGLWHWLAMIGAVVVPLWLLFYIGAWWYSGRKR